MLDSPVLDAAFGLIFIFYAIALICAGAVEMIATRMKKRSKYLLRGIRDLLKDIEFREVSLTPNVLKNEAISEQDMYQRALDNTSRDVGRPERLLLWLPFTISGPSRRQPADSSSGSTLSVEKVMNHGLVQPYKQTTPSGAVRANPSYLPASTFARVLVDLLSGSQPQVSMGRLRLAIDELDGQAQLKEALQAMRKMADDKADTFIASLEGWFDAQMDRVSGSYKRWAKRWVIVVAAVVVSVGGVDSIAIARTLYAEDTVRAAIVQAAEGTTLCPPDVDAATCAANARMAVEDTGLPLGWPKSPLDYRGMELVLKLLGLLISVGAAALGAPFWYKLLDRIGSLRNAGNRPPSSTQPANA